MRICDAGSMLIRFFRHFKKKSLLKSFAECGKSNYFGTDDCGKTCKIIGAENIALGNENSFGEGCEIISLNTHMGQTLSPRLQIGNRVRVTARCRITCASNITIDDDVLMAPDVFITDHNHGMDPTRRGGYSPQPLIVKDVHICEGVWLGQRVCVLPGVTIGEHSIIGASSVVTHDIPPYSIAVGSPARVVKTWDFEKRKWIHVSERQEG